MNKTATSRQALLEAAREIARRDGLGHISIRRTAAMCGVSVGTVYNYYPAKADLVLAVIEDFWKRVFHGGLSCDFTHGSDFSAVCGQIYTALRTHLAQFPAGAGKPERGRAPAGKSAGNAVLGAHSSGHAGCTCQGCPCAARRIYGGFHP